MDGREIGMYSRGLCPYKGLLFADVYKKACCVIRIEGTKAYVRQDGAAPVTGRKIDGIRMFPILSNFNGANYAI